VIDAALAAPSQRGKYLVEVSSQNQSALPAKIDTLHRHTNQNRAETNTSTAKVSKKKSRCGRYAKTDLAKATPLELVH